VPKLVDDNDGAGGCLYKPVNALWPLADKINAHLPLGAHFVLLGGWQKT
jgi:hypothetical protein